MTHGGDLRHAGVLVHTFGGLEDPNYPWRPCPQHSWCKDVGNRLSATLVNGAARALVRGSRGGVVLHPSVRLLCAYARDGNSMHSSKSCHYTPTRRTPPAPPPFDAPNRPPPPAPSPARPSDEEEDDDIWADLTYGGDEGEGAGDEGEDAEKDFEAMQAAAKAKALAHAEKKAKKKAAAAAAAAAEPEGSDGEHDQAPTDLDGAGSQPIGRRRTTSLALQPATRAMRRAASDAVNATTHTAAGAPSPPPYMPAPPCTPGCGLVSEECERVWLSATPVAPGSVCHFTPDQLHEALEAQQELGAPLPYNEMVVDAASLLDGAAVGAVQAVFFSASSSPQEVANARTVHRDLLRYYNFAPGERGAPPLLLLDLVSAGNVPFSLPGPAWLPPE